MSQTLDIKIALTGKMRSGKDTVYKLLEEELTKLLEHKKMKHYLIKQHSFGSALKLYAHGLFPHLVLDGRKNRQLYQEFGQLMRQLDEDVWVNKAHDSIMTARTNLENTNSKLGFKSLYVPIITDVRQPNEFNYCKENGYYIIKVVAPDEIRKARMTAENDLTQLDSFTHETESYIDDFNVEPKHIVDNRYNDMEFLRLKVRKIVQHIVKDFEEKKYFKQI